MEVKDFSCRAIINDFKRDAHDLNQLLEPVLVYQKRSVIDKINLFFSAVQKPTVEKYILFNKFTPRRAQISKSVDIDMFGVTKDPAYLTIIKEIIKYYRKIKAFYFYQSTLSDNLFECIKKIRQLVFIDCSIGDNLSRYISKIETLRCLIIIADPLTNKGIKQLMKLNLQHLLAIILIETQMTTDGLNSYKKGNCKLCRAFIGYHSSINYNELLKKGLSLINSNKLSEYDIGPMEDPQISLDLHYFAFLSKAYLGNPNNKFEKNIQLGRYFGTSEQRNRLLEGKLWTQLVGEGPFKLLTSLE